MPAPVTIPYRSATQIDARPTGRTARQPSPLLPKDCRVRQAAYLLTQNFEQRTNGVYPPAPFNTPAAAAVFNSAAGSDLRDANALLCDYSTPQDRGAGLQTYSAQFYIVPASWDDFPPASVNFPGWLSGPAATDNRPAFSDNVHIRIRYEYFVIDPDGLALGVLDSDGNPIQRVNSKSEIPVLPRAYWLNTGAGGAPVPNSIVNDLVPVAGGGTYVTTFPSLNLYKLWCAVAASFAAAWDATHPPCWDGESTAVNFGQFQFQNSILSPYAGNIVQRATSYALFR